MSEEKQDITRRVKVGDTEYTIGKFKGYKAFRIGRLLTSLGEIGPAISKKLNEFIVEYRKQNVDRIPRATLEFRYPAEAAGVSDEAWKESDGVIELANDPSQAEILAVVLPTAFDLAGEKIVGLLAWVIASDTELERKDNESEDAVSTYIEGLRKELLFRGGVDELLELATAAQEVLGEQLAGKAEKARSLLKLVGLDSNEDETPTAEEDPEAETRTAAKPEFDPDLKDEMPSTPASETTSQRPDSSTDSPPRTDGDEETSSTDRAGALSPSISD